MTEKNLEQDKEKDEDGKQTDPAAEPKKTEIDDQTPGPIPYERFKEVNEKAKGYEARLAQLEEQNRDREVEADKARQSRLKEQEKFQELATEWETKAVDLQPKLETAEAELVKHQEVLGRYAEAQIEQVPEVFRDVVAKLPLLERLEWLTANIDKLTKGQPKGVPATPKGSGTGEMTSEERRRKSARLF